MQYNSCLGTSWGSRYDQFRKDGKIRKVGKVGKIGKAGKVGKVGKVGNVGKVGKVGKVLTWSNVQGPRPKNFDLSSSVGKQISEAN